MLQAEPSPDQNYPGEEAIQERLADLQDDKDAIGTDLVTARNDPSQAEPLQAVLTVVEREVLMLERLHEAGMASLQSGGRPWNRSDKDVTALVARASAAAKSEKDTLAFLQSEDLRAGRIGGEEVTPTLLAKPDLFRAATLALYQRVVAEMGKRGKEHTDKYAAAVDALAARSPQQLIPDYVRMKKTWADLERQVRRTRWDVELQPYSPLALRQRHSGSADVVVDQLDVLVGAREVDKTVRGTAAGLGNLSSPLADWHLAASYAEVAATMSRFATTFAAKAAPGVPIAAYQGNLVADLRWATGNEAGSTVGFLTDVNGALRTRLDAWVKDLAWHERIIEGFWLYDLGGKVGGRLKQLLTLETLLQIVGFIAFLIAIQAIPFANLVVDAILLAIAGRDIVEGIFIFGGFFDAATDASTFEQLYAAAEGLQGAEDTVVGLMFTLVTAAAKGALTGYRKYRNGTRLDSLDDIAHEPVVRSNPAVRKAAEEARQAGKKAGKARRHEPGKWSSEPGVLKSAKTKDGQHTVKVTESGRLVVCSAVCDDAARRYAGELELDAKAGGTAKAELQQIHDELEPAIARRDDVAVEKALQDLVALEERMRGRRRTALSQDPGGGKRPRANEGEAGLHLEDLLQEQVIVLDKATGERLHKEGDFWHPRSGHTYDAMRPLATWLNTAADWARFEKSLVKHLYEKTAVDRTFLDLTGVNAAQARQVRAMVDRLVQRRGDPKAPVVWFPK
ncbi:hypothetical protein ACI782_07965 [Geodermatophilus sp. SYSU D00703]